MNYLSINYQTKDLETQTKVEQFITDWFNDEQEITVYTSGSTGIPKELKLNKKWMRNSALASGKFFQFEKGQKVLLCLNAGTIGGKMLILRAILFEMELIVADVCRNPIKNLTEKIDFMSVVPLQIQTILNESPQQLKWIKNCLIGGAAVSNDIENRLKNLPTNAYESFGMTETMSHVALKKLNDDGVFHAIEGICFSSEEDTLIIHAANLGYDRLGTNDIVELISPTSFKWKGRKDFVINSGGYKFFPETLEQKIGNQLACRYFISSDEDELLGSKIVLIVEGIYSPEELENIAKLLSEIFSNYEKPKKIYAVASFIETPSGKINRLATRKIS